MPCRLTSGMCSAPPFGSERLPLVGPRKSRSPPRSAERSGRISKLRRPANLAIYLIYVFSRGVPYYGPGRLYRFCVADLVRKCPKGLFLDCLRPHCDADFVVTISNDSKVIS